MIAKGVERKEQMSEEQVTRLHEGLATGVIWVLKFRECQGDCDHFSIGGCLRDGILPYPKNTGFQRNIEAK